MKILFYCIHDLNEAMYAKYNVNGLRLNGHDVVSTMEYTLSEYKKFNDPDYLNAYDLIIYTGFSFGNMTTCQGLQFSPAIQTKKPVVVLYYDNPFRYMNILLDHVQRKNNFYIGCCDRTLTNRLFELGIKSVWNPCCFDPSIQCIGDKKKEFDHDIAFAGTVLSWDRINALYSGKTYREIEILKKMISLRTPGKFFDYSDYLKDYVPIPSKDTGEMSFVNLMSQKAMLRFEMFGALEEISKVVDVYGKGDFKGNDNIITHGNLDQHFELPDLYRSAKINLSIELLPSSTHQRIFEIFACGGFALLEYKSDDIINFNPQLVEKVRWNTLGELKEKVIYFLDHEEERKQISKEFYDEVTVKHSNTVRMKQLINNL